MSQSGNGQMPVVSVESVGVSSGEAAPPGRWKFWATSAWGLAIMGAWVTAQFAVFLAILLTQPIPDLAAAHRLVHSGLTLAVVSVGSAPFGLGALALAVWLSGRPFWSYLGVVAPSRSDWIVGLVCLAVLLAVADFSARLLGHGVMPTFVSDMYRGAREAGALPLLALALVVIAPVTEELIFRGFLFRGWAASPLGAGGAILLTSFLWAAAHVQYDLFYMTLIFVLGLLFGWLRQRSGSTILTMGLHGIVNLWALLQAALLIPRLP